VVELPKSNGAKWSWGGTVLFGTLPFCTVPLVSPPNINRRVFLTHAFDVRHGPRAAVIAGGQGARSWFRSSVVFNPRSATASTIEQRSFTSAKFTKPLMAASFQEQLPQFYYGNFQQFVQEQAATVRV